MHHLVFHHVVPPLNFPGMDAVFLDGVEDAYSGPYTLGVDGTFITLRANASSVEVE